MKNIFYFFIILFFTIGVDAQANDTAFALSYMSYLSGKLVNRTLNDSEKNLINEKGINSFQQIVTAWTEDPKFFGSVKNYMEILLSTNGNANGVDFNLPGYLGFDIAKNNRPFKQIIMAKSCVDKEGRNIPCDTGAPFTAGVLTTKAFLKKAQGAYNISRAGKLMHEFLCSSYPLPASLEPPIKQDEMVPEFATTAGPISFGNGNNCYSCHSQFGHHTQFFVKFDLDGNYRANATGLPNPNATDGYSQNNLLVSHYKNPTRAQDESGQILGQKAKNLAEAATLIANSERFLPCAVKNLMRHFLRLTDQNIENINPELFNQIASQAKAMSDEPSFSHLMIAIVTSPNVYNSFKKKGALP